MIEFARPWILLLLPFLLAWGWLRRDRLVAVPQFLPGFSPSTRWGGLRAHLATGLRLGAIGVLTLALAGPETIVVRAVYDEGLAVVLALDLSGSMGQADPSGQTRLETAKREVGRFVESRPQDVIGLVTFGDDAVTRVPPTQDHRHLLETVRTLVVGRADEGTALGMGVGLAAFAAEKVDAASRIVVVLSDGRNNRGHVDPGAAAAAGRALGVSVHAIGLGREAGPDPLDSTMLRAIASRGGGRFYRASDSQGLATVLNEIGGMEESRHPPQMVRSASVHFRPLLALGWLLVLFEVLVIGLPWRARP